MTESQLASNSQLFVQFTVEEFEEFYEAFEQLHSVYSDDTKIAAAIKHQLKLWRMLQGIKDRAASDERHPSPEAPQTS